MIKKIQTCFGKIAISKNHVLCKHTQHFGITAKLQEILCLLAQGYVFQEAAEILTELLGIHLSAKQIQRLSENYGQQLETQSSNSKHKAGKRRLFYP
jgi:hypothetical protein